MTWINKGVITTSTPIMNQDFVRNILGINVGTAGGTPTTNVTFTKWEDDTTGKTILVPSMYQLSVISWKTLKTTGCLDGTKSINIEGVEYSIYLPTGGLSDKEIGEVDYFGIFDGAYSIPSGNHVLCKDEIDSVNVRMRRKDVWAKASLDLAGAGLYILLILKNENGFPIISQENENLGDISSFSNISYTIREPDSERFSLEEKLDGNTIRNLSSQTDGSFILDLANHWEQLQYGKHIVEIIATDINNKQSTSTIIFNKVKSMVSTIPTDSNLVKAVAHMEEVKKEVEYQNFRLGNFLEEKGIEVVSGSKMSTLINKVKEIEIMKHDVPLWASNNLWFSCATKFSGPSNSCCIYEGNKIFGMSGGTGVGYPVSYIYDTEDNTWTELLKTAPTYTNGYSICNLNENIYYLSSANFGVLNDEKKGWNELAMNPSKVYSYIVPCNGGIYALSRTGNYDNNFYDVTTNTWTTKAKSPLSSDNMSKPTSLNNKIYISLSSSFRCYDAITDIWTNLISPISSVADSSLCSHGNKIFLIGGYSKYYTFDMYDIKLGIWTTPSVLPNPRKDINSVVVGDRIYNIAGYNDGIKSNNDCYLIEKSI